MCTNMQEEGYAYTFPAPTMFFDEFVRNTPATNLTLFQKFKI